MNEGNIDVDPIKLANLAVAVWRTHRRCARAESTPEPVALAAESALDRLNDMAVVVDEMVGQAYHDNLRVNVVEHVDGAGPARIVECLSPAVFFRGELLRPADVVVEGSAAGGTLQVG